MGFEIYIIIIVVVFVIALLLRFSSKGKSVQNNQVTYSEFLTNNGLSENDSSVIFAVEDVFSISGKSVIVGAVVKGSIKIGDILNYTDQNSTLKQTTVLGIEMFRKTLEVANTGDSVGIMLDTTDKLNKGSYLFRKN